MNRLTRGLLVVGIIAVVGLGVAYVTGMFEGEPCDITGTITRDGKPLAFSSEEGQFLVLFFPEPRRGRDPYQAETDRATGTFKVSGIKSGRYRVAIYMFNAKFLDDLQNKYDPNHTPLEYRVTDDGQVLNIDLPKELPR
jgi:hypothetical protein